MLVEPDFAIPWRTTAAVVFALAYFISSVDLIPDAIPVLGFVDDAFVVAEVVILVVGDFAALRRAPAEASRRLLARTRRVARAGLRKRSALSRRKFLHCHPDCLIRDLW